MVSRFCLLRCAYRALRREANIYIGSYAVVWRNRMATRQPGLRLQLPAPLPILSPAKLFFLEAIDLRKSFGTVLDLAQQFCDRAPDVIRASRLHRQKCTAAEKEGQNPVAEHRG